MAGDLNVVTLVGRLTRDAELRMLQNGNGVLRFALAVNRRKRSADGVWEDEASFIDCAMFGKSAVSMSQYMTKGRQVALQGELRQNRWESNGQARSKLEVAAFSVQLLASPQGQSRGGYQRPQQQMTPPPVEPVQEGPASFDDDDIPF